MREAEPKKTLKLPQIPFNKPQTHKLVFIKNYNDNGLIEFTRRVYSICEFIVIKGKTLKCEEKKIQ